MTLVTQLCFEGKRKKKKKKQSPPSVFAPVVIQKRAKIKNSRSLWPRALFKEDNDEMNDGNDDSKW